MTDTVTLVTRTINYRHPGRQTTECPLCHYTSGHVYWCRLATVRITADRRTYGL